MATNSDHIDSVIQRMDKHTIALSRRKKLEGELKYLRTFFLCVERWSNVDIVVREDLADLMADAEVEFADAKFDMEHAEQQVDPEEKLIEVYSELEGKIAQFRPKMRDGYAYLSQYCFRARSPVTGIKFWKRILLAVYESLETVTLHHDHLKVKVKTFSRDLESLRSYMRYLNKDLSSVTSLTEFWIYLGGVATCAARLSYLCWVDGMDPIKSKDLILLVSDLHQKITPTNSKTINVYFGLFKAFRSIDVTTVTKKVTSFLVEWVSVNKKTNTVRLGLKFLILFLICAPDEFSDEVNFIGLDIETVLAKAVSLSSLADNSKSEIYQLLGEIEILIAEAVLMGLMNKCLKNKTTSVKFLKALRKGVKKLQDFSKKPPKRINDKGKLILTDIEAVAIKSASLYDKFDANPADKDAIRDVLKLLVNIRLLKAQVFWLELLNKNTTSKDNIEAILEGLEFQRKFVSGNSTGNSESGKLILGHVDEVSCKAMSIYHSIHTKEGAENLVEEMKIWVAEHAKNVYVGSSCFNFPKTNGLGSLDFCLENLSKLLNANTNFSSPAKHLIESVLIKDLESLRSFICDTAEQCKVHQESEILHKRIIDMAYEADYTIDFILLRNGEVWYHTLCLSDVIEEIKRIKAEVEDTVEKKTYAAIETVPVTKTLRDKSGPLIKEAIVSLKDQEEIIINQLTRGSERRDTISIVGMGGIGKTTLVKEVFKDHTVKEHFNVRAWCSVSERYKKRDLLLEILSYVPKLDEGSNKVMADIPEQNDEFDKDTDDDIAHKLCQRLMGRKYLIVMDDMWDIQAYNDMRMSFPEDSNGSRILFTSRDSEVVSKAGGTSEPHPLRGLSKMESWKLLEAKIFHGKDCPQELEGIGKRIATGCEGLPIAVIAIGGLLERTKKNLGWWMEVAEDINAHIAEDPESRCMSILGLSYKHLPDHLKPCFLYFSAFLGNKEILVQKLLRLWIAEGFVRKVDPDVSIEDVAEAYLEDLICRSLVIVTKERSQGGFKACQVHDMLRELCKTKAEEDNFLRQIKGYESYFSPSSSYADYGVHSDNSSPSITYKQHRVSIHSKRNHLAMLKPSGSLVRSLLFFPTTDTYPRCPYDVSFISNNFRLLRVLDFEDVNMGTSFPSCIELLKRLRYLALSGDIDSVPSTLAELWNLETLCVKGLKGQVVIPDAILSMESLRHLYVNDTAIFCLQERESKLLCNLVTLSSTSLSCGEFAEKLMKRLLNIKKIRCIFVKSHDHSVECKRSPVLSSLKKLESLKVSYYDAIPSPCEYDFGSSLRKLAISRCHLPRKHICTIGKLPKLEVLKLISVAFDDQTLDMSQEMFGSLKYLKLENLAVSEWNADSDHLPVLERLVFRKCKKLEEVSSSFEESATLHTIELQWCSKSAESSVKEIQKGQYEWGNKKFRLFINLLEWDHLSS